MVGLALLAHEVIAVEQPAFGFRGDLFAVAANTDVEGAVGDEVGKDKFLWWW